MKRLSIRARLTFWYTGILACTLLILGVVGYGLLMHSLWQDIDATLEGVAKVMARLDELAASGVELAGVKSMSRADRPRRERERNY